MTMDAASAVDRYISDPPAGINCFGCAPTNPIGLRLEFDRHGRNYLSTFTLGGDYESYPGVIHGGIVATVVDELMSQAVYRESGASVYTVGLRVRYGQPMRTQVVHHASAQVDRSDTDVIVATGRIENAAGELVAAATGSFSRIPDSDIARLRRRLSEGPAQRRA